MYKPLAERVPEGTSKEERITHLVDYYRTFLCEGKEPESWSQFDYEMLRILIDLKQRSKAVELLS